MNQTDSTANTVADWLDREPESLLLDPHAVLQVPRGRACELARLYSRRDASRLYDDIGFRFRAATPDTVTIGGSSPLLTLPMLKFSTAAEPEGSPERLRLEAEQMLLRHRPLTVPSGHWDVEASADFFTLIATDDPFAGHPWTFPRRNPPEMILSTAQPSDARQLLFRTYPFINPIRWVPMPVLLKHHRFRRMQDWDDELDQALKPGHYYLFISHRWLTGTDPDPEAEQAQRIAWSLLAQLCEALRLAQRRGLHNPRLASPWGGPVGVFGSDLAESIIVNLLRDTIHADTLTDFGEELSAAEATLAQRNQSSSEQSFQQLASLLSSCPQVSALFARFRIWYDYGCLPQEPRTPSEQKLFEESLGTFRGLPMVGYTIALTENPADFLSRAWCTMELLTAARLGSWTDERSLHEAGSGERNDSLRTQLLEFRANLVWRALLDTEVFRVQSARECMARLSLEATVDSDIDYLYSTVRAGGPPSFNFMGGAEAVSGTLALPPHPDGGVFTSAAYHSQKLRTLGTLDSTAVWDLSQRGMPLNHASFISHKRGRGPTAHVVALALCEGEGVLLTDWIMQNVTSIEDLVGKQIASSSWVASDIAPVGEMPEGSLNVRAVEADTYVVVGRGDLLSDHPLMTVITGSVLATGRRLVTIALGTEGNVQEVCAPGDAASANTVPLPGRASSFHAPGGLFLGTLIADLAP